MAIRARQKPSVEFSASTIADIVFLMLIYFIISSNFMVNSSLNVDLPQSSAVKGESGKNAVTITWDGRYAWNEIVLEKEEELAPYIRSVLTDADKNNNTITLRTDRTVTMDKVAYVMGLVQQHGGRIVILTKKE